MFKSVRRRRTVVLDSLQHWRKPLKAKKLKTSFIFITFCFVITLAFLSVVALDQFLPNTSVFSYSKSYWEDIVSKSDNQDTKKSNADNTKRNLKPSLHRSNFKLDYQHARVLARYRRNKVLLLRLDNSTTGNASDSFTTAAPMLDTNTTSLINETTTQMMDNANATTAITDMDTTAGTSSTEVSTEISTFEESTTVSATTTRPETTPTPLIIIEPRSADLTVAIVGAALGVVVFGLLLFILIFFCCPCACCFALVCCKRRHRRYEVTKADAETYFSPEMAYIEMETMTHEMRSEDMLKDALQVGSIAVLEFALKEARAVGPDSVDIELLAKAEKTLNEWKRATFLLNDAYDSKDPEVLAEYMKRFEELEIKDDSGIYQKSSDFQNKVNESIAALHISAQTNDEVTIIAAITDFNAVGLLADYMASVPELKEANEALSKIKQDKLLKGKSEADLKAILQEAINHKDVPKITAAIHEIEQAGISTLNTEVSEGRRVCQEVQDERRKMHDESWQKLFDASQARDAAALRESLRLSSEFGVDEEQIREGEKLLKLVEREDQLLHEMRELIVLEDSAKLMEAIAVFRTPGLQLVDKTRDVEKAEDVVQQLREKERLKRAKGDAMWRLQNARNIGDIIVMEGMIKALENLAAMGEEIDEAVLLRAKTELETIRGRVDNRKQMEAIKSAISRMVKAENLAQLADLIEQMVELSSNESFTMTADDSRVLDESRGMLHDLRRKHAIIDEMEAIKPIFELPQIPDSLEKLKEGVQTMTKLKESAGEFEGVFGAAEDDILTAASMNTEQLQAQVDEMNIAMQRLEDAMNTRNYNDLLEAINLAKDAPFVDAQKINNAQDLAEFLNPITRVNALVQAIKSRDIADLTLAIGDFKEANIKSQAVLLEKAERRLTKLIKIDRKQRKAERKRNREETRRREAINALDRELESAINARDTNLLQDALEKCENSGYQDKEIPLFPTAEELLDNLTIARLRENLLEAIERRDIYNLEHSIDQADFGGYVEELGEDYVCAKDLLFHLRELHRLREAISGMNRSLISEIHRYRTPPPPVHTVMTAALIMLGEKRKDVTKWVDVQTLIGKMGDQSITRRVRRRAPGDVTTEIRQQVEQRLEGLNIDMVQDISKGAGAFFAWMQCMVKESLYVTSAREDDARPSTSA